MKRTPTRYVDKLGIAPDLLDLVIAGSKRSTVRRGSVNPRGQTLVLEDRNGREASVRVTEVQQDLKLAELSDEVARADGFESSASLRAALRGFYPDMKDDELLTLIRFELETS